MVWGDAGRVVGVLQDAGGEVPASQLGTIMRSYPALMVAVKAGGGLKRFVSGRVALPPSSTSHRSTPSPSHPHSFGPPSRPSLPPSSL